MIRTHWKPLGSLNMYTVYVYDLVRWVCCVNTWHSPNAVLMLVHRLRRWPSLNAASVNFWFRVLVHVRIYRRLRIGRDGHLDQSGAYDIYIITCTRIQTLHGLPLSNIRLRHHGMNKRRTQRLDPMLAWCNPTSAALAQHQTKIVSTACVLLDRSSHSSSPPPHLVESYSLIIGGWYEAGLGCASTPSPF